MPAASSSGARGSHQRRRAPPPGRRRCVAAVAGGGRSIEVSPAASCSAARSSPTNSAAVGSGAPDPSRAPARRPGRVARQRRVRRAQPTEPARSRGRRPRPSVTPLRTAGVPVEQLVRDDGERVAVARRRRALAARLLRREVPGGAETVPASVNESSPAALAMPKSATWTSAARVEEQVPRLRRRDGRACGRAPRRAPTPPRRASRAPAPGGCAPRAQRAPRASRRRGTP